MDIVLHVGAHRTGSTTFQAHLGINRGILARQRVAYWGPDMTRQGLFAGLVPQRQANGPLEAHHKKAEGRVLLRLDQAIAAGTKALLISEENIIGSVRDCIREGELYPATGQRATRYGRAFGGRINRLVVSIRSQDTFWASAMAMAVARGMSVPALRKRALIAQASRGWRHLITDLARALPEAEIIVTRYETHRANPHKILQSALRQPVQTTPDFGWLNRAPDLKTLRTILRERGQDPDQLPSANGSWQPFEAEQLAALREAYADDLFWLAAGADGLATLTEDLPGHRRENAHAPAGTRGHEDDKESRLDKTG